MNSTERQSRPSCMTSLLPPLSFQASLGGLFLAMVLLPMDLFAQSLPETEETSESLSAETIQIRFKNEAGEEEETVGEVWVQSSDGGVLLLTPDGQLRTILKEEQLEVSQVEQPMQPMTQQEIFDHLLTQLPAGFALRKTKHYLIVYNTSEAYAEWVGLLFERLYRGFYNYWDRNHQMELEEPRFPLVAVVFRDKQSYIQFARRSVGEAAETMIGFYNMKTNRMVTYDLTGVNGIAAGNNPQMSNARLINRILSRPQAERTVATIVHEAVHQIAYNSGLQVRLADNPRWLSEGMAMFFESPDFSSSSGWSMGKINYHNLIKFKQRLPQRQTGSLTSLISSDARLLESQQAAIAYPESWALTYFLMKTKKQQFSQYIQDLAKLPPLGPTDEKARVETFKQYFGDDMQKLERDFLRYMARLR